jgi:hypothetical protein
LLLKSVKVFTKKFINDNVIKSLEDKFRNRFEELITDRNVNLITIFKSFNDHYSLSRLEKEVCEYIKNNKNGNTINNTKSLIIGSSDSDVEEFSMLMAKKTKQFTNFIKALGHLTTTDKSILEHMFERKSSSLVGVIEEWERKKDISSAKAKITKLITRNRESSQSISSNNKYSSPEPKKIISPTKESDCKLILNKLERGSSKKGTITSIVTNSSNNSPPKTRPLDTNKYLSFEELVNDLVKTSKISPHQHKYLLQRYKSNDDIVLSSWEVYVLNNNYEDLIESIKIFSSNHKRYDSNLDKTPVGFANNKSEIIDFLKSKDNKEKDEIKIKQLHIIELLARENMLNKNSTNVVREMVNNENHLIISAFEIFSVTKDHWDFCETLNLLTDIYNNNNNNNSNANMDANSSQGNKKTLEELLEMFNLKSNEKDIIRAKFKDGDDFLLSAIEFYEISKDSSELLDNFKIIIGS